jgi:hypothetical protein
MNARVCPPSMRMYLRPWWLLLLPGCVDTNIHPCAPIQTAATAVGAATAASVFEVLASSRMALIVGLSGVNVGSSRVHVAERLKRHMIGKR